MRFAVLRAVPYQVAAPPVRPPLRSAQRALRGGRGRSPRSPATGTFQVPPRGAVGSARTLGVLPPDCRPRRAPPSDGGIRFRETARGRWFARPTSPPPEDYLSVGTPRTGRSARGHGRR